MNGSRFYCGVFLVTQATLMLQLIQTRILSVMLWYHLAFFVISIAMFGLTAGAVWVYLRGHRFTPQSLVADLTHFTTLLAVTTVLALALEMTLVPVFQYSLTFVVVWLELAIVLSIPFFFSGVVVSLALTRSPFPVARVYGVDLVGAAFGCLSALVLLDLTDGPSATLWAAAVAALGALCFSASGVDARAVGDGRSRLRRPAIILFGLMTLAAANGLVGFGLQPLYVKGSLERRGPDLLFEEWNSFSRISAISTPDGAPSLWGPSPALPPDVAVSQQLLLIDGGARTWMHRFSGDVDESRFLRYDVTNLAYFLPGRRRAAVVGVGGGRDILAAWTFGLRDITGVEINPIFVDLLTRHPRFADYAGLARLDGVRLVVDEARSWFARTTERFDIVQMSLIDTWAATGAGAFTLSENGLYTVEAWRTFLNRLTPNGVFTVSRWYAPGAINETGRMVSLATAALLARGVRAPRQHVFVATTANIATLIVSATPLTPRDLDALGAAVAALDYRILISPALAPPSGALSAIIGASTVSELERAAAPFDLDLTPPTDDRPFFFNQLPFYQPLRVLDLLSSQASTEAGVVSGNLVATTTLLVILIVSILLVLTAIVIPLRAALVQVGGAPVVSGTAYFLLIGMGFMLVEIGLLQRLSVFLGHPIYSLSVVLFSIIATTGVGSFLCERRPLDTGGRLLAWSVATGAYVIALAAGLSPLCEALAGVALPVKIVVAIAAIAPAGVLMGFGFPTGIQLVSAIDPRPTPWFWGINGAASVVASIVALACSIAFGISVTLTVGGLCYLALPFAGLVLAQRAAHARSAPDEALVS